MNDTGAWTGRGRVIAGIESLARQDSEDFSLMTLKDFTNDNHDADLSLSFTDLTNSRVPTIAASPISKHLITLVSVLAAFCFQLLVESNCNLIQVIYNPVIHFLYISIILTVTSMRHGIIFILGLGCWILLSSASTGVYTNFNDNSDFIYSQQNGSAFYYFILLLASFFFSLQLIMIQNFIHEGKSRDLWKLSLEVDTAQLTILGLVWIVFGQNSIIPNSGGHGSVQSFFLLFLQSQTTMLMIYILQLKRNLKGSPEAFLVICICLQFFSERHFVYPAIISIIGVFILLRQTQKSSNLARRHKSRMSFVRIVMSIIFLISYPYIASISTLTLISRETLTPRALEYARLFTHRDCPVAFAGSSRLFFGYNFELARDRLTHLFSSNISTRSGTAWDKMFGWVLFNHTEILNNSSAGVDGIVICLNERYISDGLSTLETLRRVHNTTLPIQIFYASHENLGLLSRSKLASLGGQVTLHNINEYYSPQTRITGFAIKPLALLATSFRRAILIDADILFLQPPVALFTQPLFLETGALFFKDRIIETPTKETLAFLNRLLFRIPRARREYLDSTIPLLQGRSAHAQESGVVCVDKSKPGVMDGLHVSAFLNLPPLVKKSTGWWYGDKETFWVGFEIARASASWAFTKFSAGTVGEEGVEGEMGRFSQCSAQILHLDYLGEPFWANGGFLSNKYDLKNGPRVINFTHWLVDEMGVWTFKKDYLACLMARKKPVELAPRYIDVFNKAIRIYHGAGAS